MNYRTSVGKKYYSIESYFKTMPVDMSFKIGEVIPPILQIRNQTWPENMSNDDTWIGDGLRTLSEFGKERVLINYGGGQYKLLRHFNHKKDYGLFVRNYNKIAHPGRTRHHKRKEGMKKVTPLIPPKKEDKTDTLTLLGDHKTKYQYNIPDKKLLETFVNQYPGRDYRVEYIFKEFTSLCPKTGQPDFAVIKVEYTPDKLCIETKSLKVYFLAYRQYGSFMETITNKVLEDCVSTCKPRWMKITSNFNARGGTLINVEAEHGTS